MTLIGRMRDEQAATCRACIRGVPAGGRAEPVFQRMDLTSAVANFHVETGAALPPSPRCLLVDRVPRAMRLSNAAALAMLDVICRLLDEQMQDGRRPMRRLGL